MNLSYKDSYYYLNFEESFEEKMFFVNSINLAFSLIKESYKDSENISKTIKEILSKMIKYYNRDSFLLKESTDVFKVKKEYLDLLFEHIQTVIMIILTKEKNVLDVSLVNQYEFLDDFFKRFLKALKDESK